MSSARLWSLVLIVFATSKVLYGQFGAEAYLDDSNNNYLDMICQNNGDVDESLFQRFINWGEIPVDSKEVRRIVEIKGRDWLPESIAVSHEIMIDGEPQLINVNDNIQYLSEYDNKADTTTINTAMISLQGLLKDAFDDSGSKSVYKGNRLIQQVAESGVRLTYEYFPSGLLKEINADTVPFLSSTLRGDTVVYQSQNDFLPGMNIFSKSDLAMMPTNEIKVFRTNNDSCYCYQNFVTWNILNIDKEINKQITQCRDGKVLNVKLWNSHSNYESVLLDDDFVYEDDVLVLKRSRISHNGPQEVYFTYNDKGYLLAEKTDRKGRKYEYDSRNSVVRIIDYWLESKEPTEIAIREIEYLK